MKGNRSVETGLSSQFEARAKLLQRMPDGCKGWPGRAGVLGSGSSVQFSCGCEIHQVCHLFPSTKTCQDALSQNTH